MADPDPEDQNLTERALAARELEAARGDDLRDQRKDAAVQRAHLAANEGDLAPATWRRMWSGLYGKPRVEVPKEIAVGVCACRCGVPVPAGIECCSECWAKDGNQWD